MRSSNSWKTKRSLSDYKFDCVVRRLRLEETSRLLPDAFDRSTTQSVGGFTHDLSFGPVWMLIANRRLSHDSRGFPHAECLREPFLSVFCRRILTTSGSRISTTGSRSVMFSPFLEVTQANSTVIALLAGRRSVLCSFPPSAGCRKTVRVPS